jgi:hypothetical protein
MYGVCKICGCTDNNACISNEFGACWWLDETHELCSHCVELADDPTVIRNNRFKYYRLGSDYIAISPNEMTFFLCCNDAWNLYAKQYTSEKMYVEMENNLSKEKITSEEFQNQFSTVVEKLHTETPFSHAHTA